jgi:hypothetical protein
MAARDWCPLSVSEVLLHVAGSNFNMPRVSASHRAKAW